MSARLRRLTVPALVLAGVLAAAPGSAADPISGATYKGKAKGDGDKIEFNVALEGGVIGSLDIQLDNRCVQGGNHYVNENTAIAFHSVKIKGSGKFKAKDKRNYPGGGDTSVAKGRFSRDGTSAKGRFSTHGTFSGGGVERVECSAKGRWKAKTNAKPPPGPGVGGDGDVPLGIWRGETSTGEALQFDTTRGGVREFEFGVEVQCTPDFGGAPFTDDHISVIERADVDGADFAGSQGPDHVSGRFDGRNATGAISVDAYFDDFNSANCGPTGEIPFTARLEIPG